MDKHVAAIDLGTNSCRCLVCDVLGNEVFKEIKAIKLGNGMQKHMLITPDSYKNGLECFEELSRKLKKYNIIDHRYIATAACRTAKNSKQFVDEVFVKTGIDLEVISADEEARLTLKGAVSHVSGKSKYVLVCDIGGGSSELILATNDLDMKTIKMISIPYGARNASELFNINDYDEVKIEKLKAEVDKYLQDFLHDLDYESLKNDIIFISASGLGLRLASFIFDVGFYDREGMDGKKIETKDVEDKIQKIYKMSFSERADCPYIGHRADIFVATCVILKTVYDTLDIKSIIASLRSAKDGIIKELIEKWQN